MSNHTTLITNIYNEEYLLPFWLHHHKDMFDHGIIVDYRSTDRSVEICKQICPTWEVRTTRNEHFGAMEIDNEFINIESNIEGIKVILNTTEFLFCNRPIKEIFQPHLESKIYFDIKSVTPYSLKEYYPKNLYELWNGLFNKDIVCRTDDRSSRFIHNHLHGLYTVGRHTLYTDYEPTPTNEIHIIWLGFHPMNERLLRRKMQIKDNIPDSDVKKGYSFHHFFEKEKLMSIHYEGTVVGKPFQEVNPILYNLLARKVEELRITDIGQK